MEKDCIFCKIGQGEARENFVYESDSVFVIPDINPSAQIHLLIIPKKHIPDFAAISADDKKIWEEIVLVAHDLIAKYDLSTKGYRIVLNGGPAAMVHHLHMHLLGGVDAKRRV